MNPKLQRINKAALAKLILIFVAITLSLTALSWAIIWFFSGFPGTTEAELTVSGQVLDGYTNEPVPNVEVRLILGERPTISHTDSEGRYEIRTLQPAEIHSGRLNYYHPDYRPVQLPFADKPLATGENAAWTVLQLRPLTGEAEANPEILRQISDLRQDYDSRRNRLIQELNQLKTIKDKDLVMEKREIDLKADLRALETQKRFLLEDSLAYQLREIDQLSMKNQLEKWQIGIDQLEE